MWIRNRVQQRSHRLRRLSLGKSFSDRTNGDDHLLRFLVRSSTLDHLNRQENHSLFPHHPLTLDEESRQIFSNHV